MRITGTTRIASSPLILTLILTTFILLSSSSLKSVDAIDFNPFKTTNNENKDGTKAAQAAVVTPDASTGTITTLEPGQEKEPISCNEIMAKAVVLASEEKEAALSTASKAQEELVQYKARVKELESKVDQFAGEIRNVTVEYEATKLMNSRVLQETKDNLQIKIDSLQKESTENVENMKIERTESLAKSEQECAAKIQQIKKQADDDMEETRSEAKARIQITNAKAAEEVKKANEKTAAAEAKLRKETHDLHEKIEKMKKSSQEQIADITSKSNARIAEIQAEADDKVHEALKDAELVRNTALQEAHDLQQDAHKRIEEMAERTDHVIQEVTRSAHLKQEQLEMETSDQIVRIETSMQEKLDDKEFELKKLERESEERIQELMDEVEGLLKKLKSEGEAKDSLKGELAHTVDQLDYWMTLHSSQGMVNGTLVAIKMQDTWDQSVRKTKSVVESHSKVLAKEIDVRSKPHRDNLERLYKEHLETVVKDSLIPFYHKHIQPVQKKVQKKAVDPLMVKGREHGEKALVEIDTFRDQAMKKISAAAQEKARDMEAFLKKQDKVTVPVYIMDFIGDVKEDSTYFVSTTMKIIGYFLIFKLRYFILSCIVWMLLFPFRFAWFFCPLRLIFGGAGKKKSGKKKTGKESKTSARNGTSANGTASGKYTKRNNSLKTEQ